MRVLLPSTDQTSKSSPYILKALKQSPGDKKIETGMWGSDWREVLGVQKKEEN